MFLFSNLGTDPGPKQTGQPRESEYAGPVSKVTKKIKRLLLAASSLAIALKVFNLKFTRPHWLDIKVPAGASRVFEGILASAILYFLFVLMLYVWRDMQRLKEMRAIRKHLFIAQSFQLMIMELIVPLVLGGFALYKMFDALSYMISNMFGL